MDKVRQSDQLFCDFVQRLDFCAKRVKNYSQLSSKTGISKSTLSEYKTGGADPSRSKLVAIANAANVSVGWLVSGEGEPDEQKTNSEVDDNSYLDHVEQAATAYYAYLEKYRQVVKPDEFGRVVALLCEISPSEGGISVSTIDRIMKLKGG